MLSASLFRSALAIVLVGLATSACTTMSGPEDLLGSVAPSPAAPRATGTLPPPPGLSANPSAAPLTPGRIGVPGPTPANASISGLEDHIPPAPPMQVQALGDLPRRADGVMILPPAPRLDVIDIGAVRDGLAGTPARTSPPTGVPPRAPASAPSGAQPPAPATQPQGGLL